MYELATTTPCHFYPIETVKLGIRSWKRRGVQMQGADRGGVRVHKVRGGLDHSNAAFLDDGPRARGCR